MKPKILLTNATVDNLLIATEIVSNFQQNQGQKGLKQGEKVTQIGLLLKLFKN